MLVEMFENPTVRSLAAALDRLAGNTLPEAPEGITERQDVQKRAEQGDRDQEAIVHSLCRHPEGAPQGGALHVRPDVDDDPGRGNRPGDHRPVVPDLGLGRRVTEWQRRSVDRGSSADRDRIADRLSGRPERNRSRRTGRDDGAAVGIRVRPT